MALTSTAIKRQAMIVAHQSFFTYFVGRDVVDAKHPLTSLVFPSQSMTRSQIGGLETSLGIGLWQQLAKRLAEANKLEVLEAGVVESPKEGSTVAELAEKLKAGAAQGASLDKVSDEVATKVKEAASQPQDWGRLKKGDGVDFHFKKSNIEYAVDIKTAHLNAKNGDTFHDMLKRWVVYRQLKEMGKVVFRARLVIPYDSECDESEGVRDWWSVHKSKASPLTRQDVWIGNDFWKELTDCADAWKAISDGFKRVAPKLKVRYEPLLSKRASASDLKELLESYGITQLKLDPDTGKLMKACHCGKCSQLTPSRVSGVLESSVDCRSRKTCGKAVLAVNDFDWLK
jgi:hypothetical protein